MKPKTTAEDTPIRDKPGYDAGSKYAIEAKQWLLDNHTLLEEKYGLPSGSLVALAHHESRFDPYARSWSGAQGMFQFTGDTARGYDLQVNDQVDERHDYMKAADAAARYLSDNMGKYGNYAQSVAQWNGGWKAADAVKGMAVSDYISPNGTLELDGFMRGVQKSAKKFGFDNLYDNIEYTAYSQRPVEPVPEPVPDTGRESINQAMVPVINEYNRRKSLREANVPSPISLNSIKAQRDKGSVAYNDFDFMNEIDRQYRLFSSGGSLVQLSGDGKTVEALLKGEERIYSRSDTKRLMELAKKAKNTKGFYLLGKFLYDATKKQDSRPPEYTDE